MQTKRSQEIRLGVSSCLLGQEVRFDGGHKRDRFVTGALAGRFRFVPVCPEVGIGLGTPRESLRLLGIGTGARLVAPRSGGGPHGRDGGVRPALRGTAPGPGRLGPCPEEPVPFMRDGARPRVPRERAGHEDGAGGVLERVYAYRRLRDLFDGDWKPRDLVRFHTHEKFLVLAHSPAAYRRLGGIVADCSARPRVDVRTSYVREFMGALATPATPGRHANVLQHVLGFFRRTLGGEERRRLLASIEDYRRSFVPLVVPVTMLRHCAELLGETYVSAQTYLHPHPKELRLRTYI